MLRCPVCGSTELYLVAGGYTGMLYRCKRCRFEGAFAIEEEEPGPGQPGDSSGRTTHES